MTVCPPNQISNSESLKCQFEHAIPHHLYADDSQLYVSFASGVSTAALNGLQSCLASVQSWMSTNTLKLNPDKTEFLLIGNE